MKYTYLILFCLTLVPYGFAENTFIGDAVAGKKLQKSCKMCHTFTKGGKNRVGPNLWNIYEQEIGTIASFEKRYSKAFKAKKAAFIWDNEHLNAYLEAPRTYIKGTKMIHKGIKNPQDRANLIEWLKTLKDE